MAALLPTIEKPADLKQLSLGELEALCAELRDYIIDVITKIGGHFATPLGAVEITVALHYVFDAPRDILVWDVGHQAYAHKILTGRREKFPTIRQWNGLSGFCKRSESPYDTFGAGHASTSISAALGFAKARDLQGKDNKVVAIIGDGGMTGGLAFEGLNNAGQLKTDLLVVLNDNKMSISPNVGAISQYLTRIVTNPYYNRLRDEIWELLGKMPIGKKRLREMAHRLDESVKNLIVPGIFFEELGFRYFGPIDGHNLEQVISTLKKLKRLKGPRLLHVLTKKGKGFEAAEGDPVGYHGIKGNAGKSKPKADAPPPYLKVFGHTACELVEADERLVAVTAAMREGTGLVEFHKKYPDRFFDTGIAEGHAVTFCGGLAAEGMRPLMAIYSTFLQRAYDHLIHDIAVQKLPVIFALDRAGLVGADGPTHHGVYDLSYLSAVPNMIIAAPKDGNELRSLLHTAVKGVNQPFVVRYPKDSSVRFDPDLTPETIPIGSWEELEEGSEVALLAVGSMVEAALASRTILAEEGIFVGVVNCRFVKPMDDELLRRLKRDYSHLITVEENVLMGGFGANLRQRCAVLGLETGGVHCIGVPDEFFEHGPRSTLLDHVGLSPAKIAEKARTVMEVAEYRPSAAQTFLA